MGQPGRFSSRRSTVTCARRAYIRPMTSLLDHALRGGHAGPQAPAGVRRAIVAGAAGPLGSQVMEQVLAGGAFAQVHALVVAPLAPALRGLLPLHVDRLAGGDAPRADTALVVFDRERFSFGREDAFARAQPHELPRLAAALLGAGVKHLVVVLPHAPAGLPQALKAGLASLDEAAVAALGFEHLVFVRPAQHAATAPASHASWLQRMAGLWLAQLRWMVPQRDQPVRAAKVAQFVAEVARQLPQAPRGTLVIAPEWLWLAAQPGSPAGDVVQRCLRGEPLP
jgi:hypothetical protein